MIICVIPGRCYKRRPRDIIRGCHNRDKGTAEHEGLRDPKFIFFYPKNERLIFFGWQKCCAGRNPVREGGVTAADGRESLSASCAGCEMASELCVW